MLTPTKQPTETTPSPAPASDTPASRTLEVTHQSAPPDYSTIPQRILDFLTVQGKVLSLGSSNDMYAVSRSLQSSYPLSIHFDIPQDQQDRFRHACSTSGFSIDATGLIRRGDCYLYAQDIGARDRELEDTTRRTLLKEYDRRRDAEAILSKLDANDRHGVNIT